MTGDEIERAIDFRLKSQANLEASIEEVDRRLGARIEEVNQRLGARVEETARQLAESNRQLAEYANMQTTLVQVVTRTFEAQAVINKRTDEKLDALIDTVNKMLSGGQGGNP
jgi:Skp family chaperone for outer membrane proteins